MYVVVNAATSADGKLSTRHREQVALSGPEDFARVDEVRAESDAVAVGVGTVLADDPHLTLDGDGGDHPARVVADSRARTPLDARVLDDAAPTYLLAAAAAPAERLDALRERGAEVVRAGDERVDLAAALAALESRGVRRLMVEGGGELLFSLFESGLVDELRLYVASTVVGGREAPTLADGEGFVDPERFVDLDLREVERVDDGVVLRYDVATG
ncbi:MAG: 2,5-diamino-6-(ribosylamino)-4(3H)-pyrimidinone 5'-phosphate reductase [Halobacteriaceae archaeon]